MYQIIFSSIHLYVNQYACILKPKYHTFSFPPPCCKILDKMFANFLMFVGALAVLIPSRKQPQLPMTDNQGLPWEWCRLLPAGNACSRLFSVGRTWTLLSLQSSLPVSKFVYNFLPLPHSFITNCISVALLPKSHTLRCWRSEHQVRPLGKGTQFHPQSFHSAPKSMIQSYHHIWPKWSALIALVSAFGPYCLFSCHVGHLLSARKNLWILSLVKPRNPIAHSSSHGAHGEAEGSFIRQGNQIQSHLQKPG